MIFNRTNPRMIIGWLLIAGAISVFVLVVGKTDQPTTRPGVSASSSTEPLTDGATRQSFNSGKRERISQPESVTDTVASRRLEDELAAGKLGAIEETLTTLAETRQLGLVAGVLKKWCREGGVEVAQWCLVYSEDSDPELSLTLCAEALSNPSDVIRDMAAARLENKTGTRFSNASDARAWLSSQPKH